MKKSKMIVPFQFVLILCFLFASLPCLAAVKIKISVERLEAINPNKTSELSDVDKTMMNALGIMDSMKEEDAWKEVQRLIGLPELVYSKYYDDLLYLYIVHLANKKNNNELIGLWGKMGRIQDSVHIFPAMLVRLIAFKNDRVNYNSELARALDYIAAVPDKTLIHGPYVQGFMLFGYSMKEDFSTDPLPVIYTMKQYTTSFSPLTGFSVDTQYIQLLEEYKRIYTLHPDRVLRLAELYALAGEKKKEAETYYSLAEYYFNRNEYELANQYIGRSLVSNPTDEKALAIKKKIDLDIALQGRKSPQPPPTPSVPPVEPIKTEEVTPACDNTYLNTLGKEIKKADLTNKSKAELRVMRNEIYARYGRSFQNEDLRDYFSKKCWYRINSSYSDALLNEIDRRNVLIIQQEENAI